MLGSTIVYEIKFEKMLKLLYILTTSKLILKFFVLYYFRGAADRIKSIYDLLCVKCNAVYHCSFAFYRPFHC